MARTKAAVEPVRQMKGSQEVMHDLFKAELATFIKNTSWQYGIVTLENVEHVHHFHTYSSRLKPQKYTNSVGGHFHEIEVEMDAKGNLVARCGPPLRKVQKKTARGAKRTVIEAVKWYNDEKGVDVLDDHTHEMKYIVSHPLSAKTIGQIQAASADKFNKLQPQTVSSPAPSIEPMPSIDQMPASNEGFTEV